MINLDVSKSHPINQYSQLHWHNQQICTYVHSTTINRLLTQPSWPQVQLTDVPSYSLNKIFPSDFSIATFVNKMVKARRIDRWKQMKWWFSTSTHVFYVVVGTERLSWCNCASGTSILSTYSDIVCRKPRARSTNETTQARWHFCNFTRFLPGFAAKQINCAIIAAFSYAAGEIKSTALSMYLANRQNANGSRRKYSRVTRFTEMYQHTSI